MLERLKESVWEANLDLVRFDLVTLTFGNASGIDRKSGLVAIKPSGVSYEKMEPGDIVLLELTGKKIEGKLRPSSDAPTHLELYRAFPEVGGIAHTHSECAAMFAQAGREIPCLGTTHADIFRGPIPVTRWLKKSEIVEEYERNTGRVIAERFRGLNPVEIPGVLVAGHGPFTWGETVAEAVEHSLLLEKIARIALGTLVLKPTRKAFPADLLEKHFRRKHGPEAYYGQKKGETP